MVDKELEEKPAQTMVFSSVLEFIAKHDKFILTAHETPDGDAVGSELAMMLALRQLGKTARIYNADPAPDNFCFIDTEDDIKALIDPDELPEDIEEYALMILDVNEMANIGSVARHVLPRVKGTFIIDHHDVGADTLEDNLILKNASSTGEILYQIFQELKIDISPDIAKSLFMAIVYDTGSFIYPKTSALTFSIAHDLVRAGANPNEIYSQLYETRSIASLKRQSIVLATLRLEFGDHVAIQHMSKDMIIESGASYEEGHQMINLPLAAGAIKVSVFFKESTEGVLRCSLRSKGDIDVAKIAQQYGGGGHKTAAGFKCPEPFESMRKKVLESIAPAFRSDPS